VGAREPAAHLAAGAWFPVQCRDRSATPKARPSCGVARDHQLKKPARAELFGLLVAFTRPGLSLPCDFAWAEKPGEIRVGSELGCGLFGPRSWLLGASQRPPWVNEGARRASRNCDRSRPERSALALDSVPEFNPSVSVRCPGRARRVGKWLSVRSRARVREQFRTGTRTWGNSALDLRLRTHD